MSTHSTTSSSFSSSLWLGRKLDLIITAWTTLAPDEIFAEMTRVEFMEATRSSSTSRATLADLNAMVSAGIAERRIADEAIKLLIKRAVCGVIGDAGYGPDCALYRAMGFVRTSERKSGGLEESAGTGAPRPGLLARLERVISGWREFAPEVSFSGMNLGQFTAATAGSGQARARLGAARTNLQGEIATREDADRVTTDLIKRVVAGVRSARRFGDDCPLYRAMGYRVVSERRPYKRRSTSEIPVPAPALVQTEVSQPLVEKAISQPPLPDGESVGIPEQKSRAQRGAPVRVVLPLRPQRGQPQSVDCSNVGELGSDPGSTPCLPLIPSILSSCRNLIPVPVA